MLKKLTLVSLLAIAAMACEGGSSPSTSAAKSAAHSIVYSKDSRSGLCFGSVTSTTHAGFSVMSITNVPCEKVEHLLAK